jgi:anti-anti-sigma factor
MADYNLASFPAPAPGAAELKVSGSITSTNVNAFAEKLEGLLTDGVRVIIVGMKEVLHISSAALAELVSVADRLDRQGGAIILTEVQPKTRVIIDTLGLRRIFEIVGTTDEGRVSAKARAEKLAKAPRLIALVDGKPAQEYPIVASKITLGTDLKNTIVLKHPQVEPFHVEVSASGDKAVVRDLGSRYGSFIDGTRIKGEATLAQFATLSVATFKFTYARGRA